MHSLLMVIGMICKVVGVVFGIATFGGMLGLLTGWIELTAQTFTSLTLCFVLFVVFTMVALWLTKKANDGMSLLGRKIVIGGFCIICAEYFAYITFFVPDIAFEGRLLLGFLMVLFGLAAFSFIVEKKPEIHHFIFVPVPVHDGEEPIDAEYREVDDRRLR
jgi:hypothetical protein